MFTLIYSYYNKRGEWMSSRIEAKTIKGLKSKLKKAYNERDFKMIERISPNLVNVDLYSDIRE